MKLIRTLVLSSGLVFTVWRGAAVAQSGAPGASSSSAVSKPLLTLRDYTVVVPVDASLAAPDYEVSIGLFQILNQSSANATNEPLQAKASTLSRTDMITFQ